MSLAVYALHPASLGVRAEGPLITATMSVSPKIAWAGTDVTFTATVEPTTGPVNDVVFSFETTWAAALGDVSNLCQPACTIDSRTHNPQWTVPSLTQTMTFRYTTAAPDPYYAVIFALEGPSDAVIAAHNVHVTRPTVTTHVTRSPTGVVMPGDTLHFEFLGLANVAQQDVGQDQGGGFGIHLGTGLADPTNVNWSVGESWNWVPQDRTMRGQVPRITTAGRVWLTFDAVVSAPLGADVTVNGIDLDGISIYTLVNKRLKFHVGPTPTPTPTPKASAKTTAKPQVSSAPAATVGPTAVLTASPGPSTSAGAASPAAAPSSPAPTTESTMTPSVDPAASVPPAVTAPPDATPTGAAGPGGPLLIVALLLIVGGGAGMLYFWRRTPWSRG